MRATAITFYSYKGGVGRSFAVANTGVILAQWGARILLVDWDIEAPGLNHYFAKRIPQRSAGVLDFLEDCLQGEPRNTDAYTSQVDLGDGVNGLHLMPAAAGGGVDYTEKVQHLNWDALYEKHDLGRRLEVLRSEWVEKFDLVRVDRRTGVTDFSGVTTAQLPDVLVFLFAASEQSLDGSVNIARRAMEARRRMPIDRSALLPVPIPARFEQREEYERAQAWRERLVSTLQPVFDLWKPRDVDAMRLIDMPTIPYDAVEAGAAEKAQRDGRGGRNSGAAERTGGERWPPAGPCRTCQQDDRANRDPEHPAAN